MSYLMHYGVKGQKWGVRRYQNEDGSLTLLGKQKYGVLEGLPKDEIEYIIKKDAKATSLHVLGSAATFGALSMAATKLISKHKGVKVNALPGAVIDAGAGAALGALTMKISKTNRLGKYKEKFEIQQSNK